MHWGGGRASTTIHSASDDNAKGIGARPGTTLPEETLRVVLMQDHRRSGRSTLYDSSAAAQRGSRGNGGITESILGDMLFGSVPMNMPAVDTKVHDTVEALVLTLVFGADPVSRFLHATLARSHT